MRTAPLTGTRLSNEKIMAALFGVILLWLLPRWIAGSADLLAFVSVLAPALLLDAAFSLRRYGRPACAVSAAVTTCILWVLTPGTPLFLRAIGAAVALVLGKQVWGGKNPVNPAILGVLFVLAAHLALGMATPVPFQNHPLLIIAAAFSLPFILVRPFVAIPFLAVLLAAEWVRALGAPAAPWAIAHRLPAILFWACIVVTDPATTTRLPLAGVILGTAAGAVAALPALISFPALASGPAGAGALGSAGAAAPSPDAAGIGAAALAVLALNLFSAFPSIRGERPAGGPRPRMRARKLAAFVGERDFTRGDVRPHARETAELTAAEVAAAAETANLYGLGGASFPTATKLRTALASDTAEKHLIVNAAECDPGLVHDRFLLERRGEEIEKGIRLLARVLGAASVSLVVTGRPGRDYSACARVVAVKPRYPCGAEPIVIREALGLDLTPGEIPAERGILVLNVQTVLALHEAVYGRKADSKWISVVDLEAKKALAVRVPLGLPVAETLDRCGLAPAPRVHVGGGAMQCREAAEDEVIGVGTNFIAVGKERRWAEKPQCFRCGRCAAVCPALLPVDRILGGGGASPAVLARCLQCGACSSVCLAGRNLSAAMKEMRDAVSAPA